MSLSSTAGSGENIHTVIWMAGGYGVGANDLVRLKIECLPSGLASGLQLPFLKWYSTPNPVADPAGALLATLTGRVQTFSWDESTNRWLPLDTPVVVPGQIDLLTQQLETIKNDPTTDSPLGYYSSHTAGVLTDAPKYNTWLAASYGSQNHGSAMQAVSEPLELLTRVEMPRARDAIQGAERHCRKRLIEQGYYAEQYFETDGSGNVQETVTVRALVATVVDSEGDTELPVSVQRYWRFQVQSVPTAPNGVYDSQGYFDPQDTTTLERVFFRVRLDAKPTLDSQVHDLPLRTFLYGDDGRRLSVSQEQVVTGFGATATIIDTAREAPSPADGQATTSAGGDPFAPTSKPVPDPVIQVGAVLKVRPDQLPGEVAGDQLAAGQADFSGGYTWDVAAYNAFLGPVTASPRPLITGVVTDQPNNTVFVSYEMRAHEHITRASLRHTVDYRGVLFIDGYQVSTQTTTPFWTDEVALNFVSDRRAPASSSSRRMNVLSWVPAGVDRQRPVLLYENERMQYIGAVAKRDSSTFWRITTFRSMTLPNACEWESLFQGDGAGGYENLYGPCLATDPDGGYRLYMTAQAAGGLPLLVMASSPDGDTWGTPLALGGLGAAANPCVVQEGNTFHLWYESLDSGSGRVAIYYATSEGGATTTSPPTADCPCWSWGRMWGPRVWSGWVVPGSCTSTTRPRAPSPASTAPTGCRGQGSRSRSPEPPSPPPEPAAHPGAGRHLDRGLGVLGEQVVDVGLGDGHAVPHSGRFLTPGWDRSNVLSPVATPQPPAYRRPTNGRPKSHVPENIRK
ncbi:MAG: hypothetical protein NTW19_16695 [Planctomycetota bacterium]|nr:hypothetical protein [Planctomycetota bacterium]